MRKEDPERPAGMNDPREMTTVDGQVPVRHSAKAPWVVHSVGGWVLVIWAARSL